MPILVPPIPQAWPFPGGGGGGGGGGMLGGNHTNGTIDDGPGGDLSSNWSSLIGIVTAIVGNVLIALALNVQRYAHTRLHKERMRQRQRRQRQRQAKGPPGYGAIPAGPDGHSSTGKPDDNDDSSTQKEISYLHSPYWWLGQVLITVGECGNFLAYGFAPASIVSPLGVVALISNCVIAPILFKEPVRLRDLCGVVIAMGGAVTVVLSANQQETKLNPHDVWDAITATAFEIYGGVTCALIALLVWASPRYGHRTILIDLGLVGLFGAYTVLATKGVSSMLSSTLLGALFTPMTYGLLVVLLGTAVLQVRYVNKALQRFDSTQVIPIQFVLFTLSVIVGSAVLYRDFERTTAEQAAKFVGGCLLTFFGVFVITSGRPHHDDDESEDDDDDDIEAGGGDCDDDDDNDNNNNDNDNGLVNNTHPGQSPLRPSLRSAAGSRRSSRASRVNFVGTLTSRTLSLVTTADTGVPSLRAPVLAMVDDDVADDNDDDNSSPTHPLLQNPWRSASFSAAGSTTDPPVAASHLLLRPGLGPSPYSADSVLQTTTETGQPRADRPVTPTTNNNNNNNNNSSKYYYSQSPLFSPSPLLSSTVTSAMADTILQHLEGGSPQQTARSRRPSTRRARSTLRASLFVPHDALLDPEDGAERGLLVEAEHHHHHHSEDTDGGGGGGGGGGAA